MFIDGCSVIFLWSGELMTQNYFREVKCRLLFLSGLVVYRCQKVAV